MILVGGWSMVIFSILYVGITLAIDSLVQGQTMLYSMGEHNLFKVVAGTDTIRTLLTFYAILPLLLIPAAVGTYYTFIDVHEANMRVGMYFATVGALALCLSLLMLPSINWHLVTYIQSVSGAEQANLVITLQALQSYLGVYLGDLLGFGCLIVWFIITSFVMVRDPEMPRAVGIIQIVISLIAVLILLMRYSGLAPAMHVNLQAPGVMALWIFISGISLISLRRH
jgi:hypothetical protein